MKGAHLRSPQDDLQQRRPVWDALSILFLDTQLDDADFAYMAKVLARSPYTDAELAAIYHTEIEPVCRVNIGMAPGYWSGFPDGWVEVRILSRGLDAARALPKLRSSGETVAWGWGGIQHRVLELREDGAHDKPLDFQFQEIVAKLSPQDNEGYWRYTEGVQESSHGCTGSLAAAWAGHPAAELHSTPRPPAERLAGTRRPQRPPVAVPTACDHAAAEHLLTPPRPRLAPHAQSPDGQKSRAWHHVLFDQEPVCRRRVEPLPAHAVVASLHVDDLFRYRGHALLVLDGTDYPKRSRGPGIRQCGMQYIGRVRKNSQSKDTTTGYVDVWAGLVLRGKRFLPLTRRLFSSTHPTVRSQNQVEEAVLDDTLTHLQRHHLSTIVVADRGFGRKALLIRLAQRAQEFVIRLDADILVERLSTQSEHLLADLLAQQPWLGEVVWYRGQAGNLRCRVRKVRAQIHDSRARRMDQARASMTFLEVVPLDADVDPLLVATSLPVRSVVDAQGVVRVYAQRWAIETGFEAMKAWGLGRFMVRQWHAIDRLLWLVAVAYALTVLALYGPHLAPLRQQMIRLLGQFGVLGRRLTVGKVAEALAIDFQQHRRAWACVWQL